MKAVIVVLLFLVLISSQTTAATIRVPVDQPTIQEGIEAAVAGDTVEVACGTYFEHGINLKGGVVLRSETGQPDCVTVDGQGLGIVVRINEFYEILGDFYLEGFNIENGDSAGVWLGIVPRPYRVDLESCNFDNNNGVGLAWGTWLPYHHYNDIDGTVSNCGFTNNGGGGVFGRLAWHGVRIFENCRFIGNGGNGLEMSIRSTPLELYDCTFANNAGYGIKYASGLLHRLGVYRCIVEGNAAGGIFARSSEGYPTIHDTKVLNNEGHGITIGTWYSGQDIRRCTISGNQGHGVLVGSYTDKSEDCGPGHLLNNTTLEDCKISGNRLNGLYHGYFSRNKLQVRRCLIVDNGLDGIGIGNDCEDDRNIYEIESTTLASNGRHGISLDMVYPSEVNFSLIAFNEGDGIHVASGATPAILSTNIYGNTGGDWIGDIAPQIDAPGNFSADPCFCGGGYTVAADSPCLPENHPWEWNTLVGALGMGCAGGMCNGPVMIEPTTWGGIKGLYR